MVDHMCPPLALPAVGCKKIPTAVDGGRISSGIGVMRLAQAERRLGLAERLGVRVSDRRDVAWVSDTDAGIRLGATIKSLRLSAWHCILRSDPPIFIEIHDL
jgi:hypothetical protein